MSDLWLPYLSSFLVGLLGGVHCIGMCGGIVSALTLGLPRQRERPIASQLPFQLAYNLGRILSYVVAGAIMGGLGMLLARLMPIYLAQRLLLALAGIFMVLLGLYLGGWWLVLNRVEALGGRIWSWVEPLGRRLLPVRSTSQALAVGAVWGWIPCGLVYTMLVNAVSAGSMLKGAGIMLAFALGTLPNLLIMGVLAGAAARLTGNAIIRRAAGLLVLMFGVITLWRAF